MASAPFGPVRNRNHGRICANSLAVSQYAPTLYIRTILRAKCAEGQCHLFGHIRCSLGRTPLFRAKRTRRPKLELPAEISALTFSYKDGALRQSWTDARFTRRTSRLGRPHKGVRSDANSRRRALAGPTIRWEPSARASTCATAIKIPRVSACRLMLIAGQISPSALVNQAQCIKHPHKHTQCMLPRLYAINSTVQACVLTVLFRVGSHLRSTAV